MTGSFSDGDLCCFHILTMCLYMGVQISFWYPLFISLVAQRIKRLPAMQETWVRFLGWEDPLEKEMETHTSILAWRIPWTEEPGRLQSMGSQRVRKDWATSLSFSLFFWFCCCSVTKSSPTLFDSMDCSTPVSLSITIFHSLPKLMSIELVTPSNYLILCGPLLLLPSMFPCIRVFSSDLALRIRWPKYWSFSFNISPSNEHPGLISSRMDWLDLLAVQGTLKSLLQHHSSKASILWCSAFFIVQLSHPYMTTGKTIALTNRPLLTK